MGDPPNVNNIPESLWQKIRQDVEDDTRRVIAIILLLSIRRMNDIDDGFTMPPAEAARRATEYADARASTLADSVVDTFKDRLRTVVTETKSPAEIRRAVRDIAESQAKNAGVTETTSANSAGEMSYADAFEKETGVELIATWHTEHDADVCEICKPLDGTEDDQWPDDHSDGPPAHCNCRCWLEFAPAAVTEGAT